MSYSNIVVWHNIRTWSSKVDLNSTWKNKKCLTVASVPVLQRSMVLSWLVKPEDDSPLEVMSMLRCGSKGINGRCPVPYLYTHITGAERFIYLLLNVSVKKKYTEKHFLLARIENSLALKRVRFWINNHNGEAPPTQKVASLESTVCTCQTAGQKAAVHWVFGCRQKEPKGSRT